VVVGGVGLRHSAEYWSLLPKHYPRAIRTAFGFPRIGCFALIALWVVNTALVVAAYLAGFKIAGYQVGDVVAVICGVVWAAGFCWYILNNTRSFAIMRDVKRYDGAVCAECGYAIGREAAVSLCPECGSFYDYENAVSLWESMGPKWWSGPSDARLEKPDSGPLAGK
jgi:hypothetical protein